MSDISTASANFIRNIISEDLASGKSKQVVTRFPPEPNGYLHIGHAKSICLNFGLAEAFGGRCHLRFDDTNPVKEEQEYIDAIKTDLRWLGFDWGEHEYYASDYFEKLYAFAIMLINRGKAYVDGQTADEIREGRGTLTTPGQESPWRERSTAENSDLFERMRNGEFAAGRYVLRAKIDMASPNLNLRDPVIYRVLHAPHHRTSTSWAIYPMYDFAHGQSDSIEGVTYSICTLEFEDHRPLYEWFLRELNIFAPRQIEFARLNLDYTVMSKRKLLQLVTEKHVDGWDDPRMPTLSGLRRRGVPAAAVKNFCERIGVGRAANRIELSILEDCVREVLNETAPRAMAVLRPLKIVITNYPAGQIEELTAPNHPQQPERGVRTLPFGREIFIERDDFMTDPPKKFFRLAPGREVRLRYAYIIKCDEVMRDTNGEICALHCTYDPATLGKDPADGRKVKGVIHWVEQEHAVTAEVRVYDRLFRSADPDAGKDSDFLAALNPESLEIVTGCRLEPALATAAAGDTFQFERLGYFVADHNFSSAAPVFNRTVTLRDTWDK
ncbi:MAG: glutamine--tRNA ligase/YqeY domain fusion protein [Desulfuromonadaceae bacterium]|nr:glutamine--tRNA ligase/YqeY domain fusion protein [Desulfuromonadaceae bacterium]